MCEFSITQNSGKFSGRKILFRNNCFLVQSKVILRFFPPALWAHSPSALMPSFLREALITFGVVFLPGCFRLFVRNLRDFYRRDMPIRRMLLSTETLTKKTHRSISVLKSNPRKVGLAITASLELTQNRDLFLELFLDFLWKSSLQQATLENQLGIESLSCVIARWSRDNY